MNKLVSLGIGLALGASVGVLAVLLFTPASGEELVSNLKQGWQETLDEARRASVARRAELEAQLREMQGKSRLASPAR